MAEHKGTALRLGVLRLDVPGALLEFQVQSAAIYNDTAKNYKDSCAKSLISENAQISV